MRVLHVHSGNLYGGVETMLATFVAHARSVRSEFALAYPGGRFAAEVGRVGAPLHGLGPVRLSRPWTLRAARRRLAAIVRISAPDAVVCHSRWSQIVTDGIARRAGIPFLAWYHGAPNAWRWQDRWAARYPPQIAVCNSEWTAGAVRRLASPPPAQVIHPAVSAPRPVSDAERHALRARHGAKDETVVILQLGRIESGKGLLEHMAALGRMPRDRSWALWIGGAPQRRSENRYYRRVLETARRLEIADRVVCLGEVRDTPPVYRAADVFAQPSIRPESFGITLVEALYAQRPVVTTSLGGAAEIVTPACGILLQPGDHEGLHAALAQLISDPARRAALGAAGPARATQLCDAARQTAAFESVVHSAARSRRC
jgi:glycosyltransferase involved in cell wall biosynthesis